MRDAPTDLSMEASYPCPGKIVGATPIIPVVINRCAATNRLYNFAANAPYGQN
jgi:hypothetical protein